MTYATVDTSLCFLLFCVTIWPLHKRICTNDFDNWNTTPSFLLRGEKPVKINSLTKTPLYSARQFQVERYHYLPCSDVAIYIFNILNQLWRFQYYLIISIKQACEPDTSAYRFYIFDSFAPLTLSSDSEIFTGSRQIIWRMSASGALLLRNAPGVSPTGSSAIVCLGKSERMNHFSIYLCNVIWIPETMWLTSCSVIGLSNWDKFLLKQT